MAEDLINFYIPPKKDDTTSTTNMASVSSTVFKSKAKILTNIIGEFGNYQLTILIVLFFSKFPVAFHQMAIIFLNPKINKHKCNGVEGVCPCEKPQYDFSVFDRTIVTEWNLICDKFWLANFNQTLFQVGVFVGSMVFGMASDRFGRKKPLIACILIQLLTGIGGSYMLDYWTFTVMRILTGASVGGSLVISFVLLMELVGTKYRYIIAACFHMPFNIGHILLSAFGFFFRDFRKFNLYISLTALICLCYFCYLPETPRWLLAAKKKEEAIRLLERIARVNKRPTENIRADISEYEYNLINKQHVHKGTVIDLFRTPNLRKKIIIMCIFWLSCGFCFYGISQYVGQLEGNLFLNVALSGTSALFGTIISIPLMWLLGRRTILIIFSYVCAACLILISVLEVAQSGFVVVFVAVCGISASFLCYGIAYLYCSELFPTVVRNASLGCCSMLAIVGAMFAPNILNLQETAIWLPPACFAVAPLIAGTLLFLLPETKGQELTTTIEEGENFGNK